MKNLLSIIAGIGAVAFAMSFIIRIFNMGQLLNSSAVGWWRASIGVVLIGMLLALIEVLKQLSKTKAA
jgi:hypothetical protein